MAWEKLGTASVGGTAIANNSWKEIGRATVSSGDTLDTSTFTAKDNMMILCYTVGSGTVHPKLHFNNDTGSNYAFRYSGNGGTDSTSTSQDYFRIQGGISGSPTQFSVSNVVNVSSQEKLIESSLVSNQNTGAGNAPSREENVGKWANTSAQINRVDCDNGQSGDYASGTELVVLGFDNDEADSGSNFWQELSSTTLTATQSGALTIPQFTTKKYLMINYYINASTDCKWKVGTGGSIDTGSNYANRYSNNGASDSTITSYSALLQHNPIVQGEVFIINKSDKEKLIIQHEIGQNQGSGAGGSGAGNVSNRGEFVGKWTNTSGQIDTLQYTKSGVSFYAGTTIKVYGAD